jgi:hypothetical protein
MTQQLAGRKHLCPPIYAVESMASVVVGEWIEFLVRNDVVRHPLWDFVGNAFRYVGGVVVSLAWCTKSSDPLYLFNASLSLAGNDLALEDYRIELFSHASRLGLTFYFITVYHATAVWIGASRIPVAYSTARVTCNFVHYFKAAHTSGRKWPSGLVRQQPNPSAIG